MTTRGLLLLAPLLGLAVFGAANFASCDAGTSGFVVDDPSGGDTASVNLPSSVPLLVTSISSPLEPDSTGRLDAQTADGAECQLISNTAFSDSDPAMDLGAKLADATGFVGWTWHISSEMQPGVVQLRLTCNGETVTAQVEIAGPHAGGTDPGD